MISPFQVTILAFIIGEWSVTDKKRLSPALSRRTHIHSLSLLSGSNNYLRAGVPSSPAFLTSAFAFWALLHFLSPRIRLIGILVQHINSMTHDFHRFYVIYFREAQVHTKAIDKLVDEKHLLLEECFSMKQLSRKLQRLLICRSQNRQIC